MNRGPSRVKILLWEDNGFVLYYKALAEEVLSGYYTGASFAFL